MQENDSQTYAYFYFMQDDPEGIGQRIAPSHAEYWKALQLADYRGGPFKDFSGGMITFKADNDTQAKEYVAGDPFVTHELLSNSWLKGWLVR